GAYEVTLVEHVSQAFVSKAIADPKKAGTPDPVKATLDHIAVYAKGVYNDPTLGETWALVTAKIAFRPEPFVFEYDTNGDGISTPRKLDKQTDKKVKEVPPPSPVDGKLSDLCFHPFLDPGRYAVWGSGNFQSPPPTNVSVLKTRVFYQTVKNGSAVKHIKDFDFTGNPIGLPAGEPAPDFLAKKPTANADRDFIQSLLKGDNQQFVLNFGSNKLVKDTFSKDTMAKDLTKPGQLETDQATVEAMVDAAAGGKLANLDPKDNLGKIIQAWIEQYTQKLPTHSGKTAYGKDAGQVQIQLLEDTSLGKRDAFATNLGKVFDIPQAELDKLNKLINAFAAGQVKNGEDLINLKAADKSKPPVAYVDELTSAQEYYAPVQFPTGKPVPYTDQVPDGNAIDDLNGNKKVDPEEVDAYMARHPELNGKPPMISVQRFRIGNEFLTALKGGGISDPAAFYAEMEKAVAEINSPPVNQFYTAELSPRPPSFAQMEHTIILKAQNDPRLDIRLKDALKEALKWVEVPGAENGETGEVAPVAIALGLSYSLKWKCFCKDDARATLERYDRAVREYKAAHGANVTLQLDDPCPAVLSTPAAAPLSAAVAALERVVESPPEQPQARVVLAQMFQRQGRAARAVEQLEAHVKAHPADAAGWNALGVALARRGGPGALERKIQCYRESTRLAPADPAAWANLCNALAMLGKAAEAIPAGLKATALRPHYVYAWMNLGVAYGNLGDDKQEEAAYLSAIRVPATEEKCPFARFNLGLCYEKRNQYPQAVAWYHDALRVGLPQGPQSREAALFHHNLARALFRKGDYPEATLEASEALRIAPNLPEAYSLLGHLFRKAGDEASSRRMFLRATKLLAKFGPSNPDVATRHAE
ncbi:MAG: tetratricopeptide repeat protein, partial [Candidatus Wallbacteria bacterium]|nr:tetratricopeptide repeat protein [Candidatus Wallbacteria bacterium]